jgi:hypothetical protein
MSSTPMSLFWSASTCPLRRVAPTHSRPTNDVVKPATEHGDEAYSPLTAHHLPRTTYHGTTYHSPQTYHVLPTTYRG